MDTVVASLSRVVRCPSMARLLFLPFSHPLHLKHCLKCLFYAISVPKISFCRQETHWFRFPVFFGRRHFTSCLVRNFKMWQSGIPKMTAQPHGYNSTGRCNWDPRADTRGHKRPPPASSFPPRLHPYHPNASPVFPKSFG